MNHILLFLSVILTVSAQSLMKIGGTSIGKDHSGALQLLWAYMTSPLIVLGFALSALAAFLWTYCLSKFDFSYAFFVASVSYILVIPVSIFVFKETISTTRWIGCAIILLGVLLVQKS